MADLDCTVRIRDAAGGLVLDLNSDGYAVVSAGEDEEVWDRRVTTSPWVDGDSEDGARLSAGTKGITVRVYGDTWAQVEQRRLALNAATSSPVWLLEVGAEGAAQVWRAGRADRSSPFGSSDVVNLRRYVNLRIPVQPTPTVTGV